MKITEVRVTLRNEEKLKAFASVTFDNEFVIRGLKVINGKQGYFVSMPSRKRPDGSYQDIAHPINNEMRKVLEERILDEYEAEINRASSDTGTKIEREKKEEAVPEQIDTPEQVDTPEPVDAPESVDTSE